MFFDDDGSYNPCNSQPGKFYFPSPTDRHQYYQCDASGTAFARTCPGNLVWDDSITTCNWPSAVPLPPVTNSPPVTSPWVPDTTPSSVTSSPVFSYCNPSPCGAHGQCLLTSSAANFVCICSGNWYGKLCDKYMGSVVTKPTPPTGPTINVRDLFQPRGHLSYQNQNLRDILNYDLRSTNIKRELYGRPKRTIDSSSKEDIEPKSSTEESDSANVESTTPNKSIS